MATFTPVGGIKITYTFLDTKNSSTTTSVMVDAAATLVSARAYADALGNAMIPTSDAQLMGYSINLAANASGAPVGVAGSRVEDKGLFGAITAAGKDVQFTVPAIKLGMLDTNQKSIDLLDAAIATLINMWITGDGVLAARDSNGIDLAQLLFGRLQQRKGLQG
jgi:hypothetical protein